MDDPIAPVTIPVHADSAAFMREVAAMRAELETGLGAGADRAGRTIETSLIRAATSGKLGFEELKTVALKALEQIAAASLRAALGGGTSGGAGAGLGSILAGLIGLPGRATGGPVAPGAAYVVGERGPELFVPTASGRIETGAAPGGGTRDVRVAITVNANAATTPTALAQSSRQVARAVKAALAE
ncbi:tail tape measure protein [Sphingomonas sp. CROZ-RG-20F-R02-07]|uniref:tail tape measure protein n=1 Tax=Sphingomonas sp. CROZ-RG-20F-R02-07 TaxID=2914832 RepID=UPI001F56A927|nr:tail tape measure protein [Sphingomonas sp. CROZ-RG-20F-R02-07]